MKILAIETSCDETAAAVVEKGTKVLSNVVSSQVSIHKEFGGVVPEVAARAHIENIIPVIKKSLKEADTSYNDIGAVAATYGPGLIGSLIVGFETAKSIAAIEKKKFISVNHLEGHIYANWLGHNPPKLPAVALIVSGGHTILLKIEKNFNFRRLGDTRDDAAGEAFDKVASILSLPYPGGPSISKAAQNGDENKYDFPLVDLTPPPKRNDEGFLEPPSPSLDFSFSGLKTAVLRIKKKNNNLTKNQVSDIAASFQKAVISNLIQNVKKALDKEKVNSFILAGGVAANQKLRNELEKVSKEYDLKFHMPDLEYCTDNAAMIGAAAYYKQQEFGFVEPKNSRVNPTPDFP